MLEWRNAKTTTCFPSRETYSVADLSEPSSGGMSRWSNPLWIVSLSVLYCAIRRLATAKSSGVYLFRLAPTPSAPCMEDKNRNSSGRAKRLGRFDESVTHATMSPGLYG